jgi:hypothetical protein
VEQVGGDDAVTDEPSLAVEVAEQLLEGVHPLDHRRRQPLERRGVDDERDRVEPPRTAGDRRRTAIGPNRQIVDEMSGTFGDEQPIDLRLPRREQPGVEQRRAQPGVPHHRFVEADVER